MRDFLIEDEIRELLLPLLHGTDVNGLEAWNALTANEFGVLSWHLGSFYILGKW